MKIPDILKLIFQPKGIAITPEQHKRATRIHRGAAIVTEITGDVLEEMGPQDDTPYLATYPELAGLFLERLGAREKGEEE